MYTEVLDLLSHAINNLAPFNPTNHQLTTHLLRLHQLSSLIFYDPEMVRLSIWERRSYITYQSLSLQARGLSRLWTYHTPDEPTFLAGKHQPIFPQPMHQGDSNRRTDAGY